LLYSNINFYKTFKAAFIQK